MVILAKFYLEMRKEDILSNNLRPGELGLVINWILTTNVMAWVLKIKFFKYLSSHPATFTTANVTALFQIS